MNYTLLLPNQVFILFSNSNENIMPVIYWNQPKLIQERHLIFYICEHDIRSVLVSILQPNLVHENIKLRSERKYNHTLINSSLKNTLKLIRPENTKPIKTWNKSRIF